MIGRFDHESGRRRGRRSREAVAVAGACLLLAQLATDGLRGQLPEAEETFCGYLINDLGYHDTAARYLAELRRRFGSSRDALADIESWQLEILRLTDKDAYLRALDEFTRKYPNHPRSTLGSLPRINVEMGKVIALFNRANDTSDAGEAVKLRERARKLFATQVKKPLDQLIATLNARVAQEEKRFRDLRRKNPRAREPEKLVTLTRSRNFAEFARVRTYLIYARQLRSSSAYDEERKKILEEGLGHATAFVEDRPQFYLMQYRAQLQKGLYETELGRLDEAIEDLTILLDLRPPSRGKRYPAELVAQFKDLYIQAVLYAAKAYNRSRRFKECVDLVDSRMVRSTKGPFALASAAEDPKLQKYFVLAQLEMAVAYAGMGQPQHGLRLIESVIEKYSPRADADPIARAYVTDARKALGSIVEIGGVALSARAYYEGGLGLYSELRQEEALRLFQLGLTSALGKSEKLEVVPLCLDKIGEINYRLGRYAVAAIAYLEICDSFPESDLVAKASQNALSAANKLVRSDAAHAGYKEIEQAAIAAYDRHNEGGQDIWVLALNRAYQLEKESRLQEALDELKKIPAQDRGKKVPVYWTAQATVANILFKTWEANEPAVRKEKKDFILKVAAECDKVIKAARAEGNTAAAVMASFVRGQIFTKLGDWQQAAESLRAFIGEFSDDRSFRPAALYFLIDADLRSGAEKEAEKAFEALEKTFPTAPSTQYSALLLAEHFNELGGKPNLRKAARYVLAYAKHPLSASELNDLGRLLDVIDTLIRGELTDEAEKLLVKAEKMLGKGDNEAQDRLRVRLAFLAYSKSDYRKVIDMLAGYIRDYDFNASPGPDDADIFFMYGDAHLRLKNPPALKSAQIADGAIGFAVKLTADAGKKGLFWERAFRWMQVKKHLGEVGDQNALKDIVIFVKDRERTAMGGPRLKKEFLALRDWAQRKLEVRGRKKR